MMPRGRPRKDAADNDAPEEARDVEVDHVELKIAEAPKKALELSDLPGIGTAAEVKLREAGYDSVLSIAVATVGEVVEAAGVTEALARRIITKARDSLDMGFVSGEEVMEKRKRVIKIETRSKELNSLLGGGFETGAIVECYGQFGSGKTQIANSLVVACQKADPNAFAVFIDTESTFRPERIKQLAEAEGLDPEKVLKQCLVARAFNSDHQMLLLQKVEEMISKKHIPVRLLVVDSLTAHFRAEFVGRGTLANRQQQLNRHLHDLIKIADMHNVCVYVTNQAITDPGQFFGDPTRAVGGNIVGHSTSYRVYLRRGKKSSRVARLMDSPHLPEREVSFMIDETGIRDFDDKS